MPLQPEEESQLRTYGRWLNDLAAFLRKNLSAEELKQYAGEPAHIIAMMLLKEHFDQKKGVEYG